MKTHLSLDGFLNLLFLKGEGGSKKGRKRRSGSFNERRRGGGREGEREGKSATDPDRGGFDSFLGRIFFVGAFCKRIRRNTGVWVV